ncbi:MAG: alpha/beta fold hydrolase [Patescibacteria group bacterium]|jgi:hypothetical protein
MSSKFTRAVIVHGWDGSPNGNWFPWAKAVLEQQGISTVVPSMPHPSQPEIGTWVPTLAEAVGEPSSELVLIGHSMGCQTIMRYLETLPAEQHVGAVILVAGFFHLTGLQTDEERSIAQPWLVTPLDFATIQDRAQHITVILSDNDPFVPVAENKHEFETKLGARVIVLHGKGHLNEEAGISELPLLLEILAELQQVQ